jgi:16S rRNA (guanine966-N2)-methyltransferase
MLRIVGGKHRGRKLRFPPDVAVRPTPDRVRETLFNWLAPRISGAYCLDAFAGSGALGIEALSRGARAVTFLERDKRAAAAISNVLTEWAEPAGRVMQADTTRWLEAAPTGGADTSFDIVFLDPPFDSGLLSPIAHLLDHGWLAPDARIYVEHSARDPLPDLPKTWELLKSNQAGEVGYHLFARRAASHEGSSAE